MPRSLKLYIAGVVTLSAFALLVATLVFPAESRNRPHVRSARSGVTAVQSTEHPDPGWHRLLDVADARRFGAARTTSAGHASGRRDGADRCGDVAWRSRGRWLGRRHRHNRDARAPWTIPWYGTLGQPRWGRRCRPSSAACATPCCTSSPSAGGIGARRELRRDHASVRRSSSSSTWPSLAGLSPSGRASRSVLSSSATAERRPSTALHSRRSDG